MTVTSYSSKIPFLYGAVSYVVGIQVEIQGPFKSCSKEGLKELLKHEL